MFFLEINSPQNVCNKNLKVKHVISSTVEVNKYNSDY